MADKSTRWAFTAYEGDYPIIDAIANEGNDLIAEIGYQDEICPNTQKKHRQGYLRTVRQVRFAQLKAITGGIHIEVARNWSALVAYCKKADSRDLSGSQVSKTFERPMRLHEMLIDTATNYLLALGADPAMDSRIDRQTDRRSLLRLLVEHSMPLVRHHPEYATVLSRQDAKDSWCNYFPVWLDKAREGLGWVQ